MRHSLLSNPSVFSMFPEMNLNQQMETHQRLNPISNEIPSMAGYDAYQSRHQAAYPHNPCLSPHSQQQVKLMAFISTN